MIKNNYLIKAMYNRPAVMALNIQHPTAKDWGFDQITTTPIADEPDPYCFSRPYLPHWPEAVRRLVECSPAAVHLGDDVWELETPVFMDIQATCGMLR